MNEIDEYLNELEELNKFSLESEYGVYLRSCGAGVSPLTFDKWADTRHDNCTCAGYRG